MIASLLPLLDGLRWVRRMRPAAAPWPDPRALVAELASQAGIRRPVDILLHPCSSGPMTCGVMRPAIVLPREARDWDRNDLHRALVHEIEHVRRADYLVHCLARAVCSLYWFHPLAWVAWRKLRLEAERACDDAVLLSSEPTAYADQLVAFARHLLQLHDSVQLAFAGRADLRLRVRAILSSQQHRGRLGRIAGGLVCATAIGLLAIGAPLQTVAAQQALPQFAAVSVKADPPQQGTHSDSRADAQHLTMSASLHRIIIQAYGISERQLEGEPGWFNSNHYTINAVTAAPTNPAQMMLMLRATLADRFQLKLRQDTRKASGYILEVAPGGAKFKPLQPGAEPPQPGKGSDHDPGVFVNNYDSIVGLVDALNDVYGGRLSVDRPVVDGTKLVGRYDLHLRTAVVREENDFGVRFRFPNLFHDLESELGLRLVASPVPVTYFIVQHAVPPTPN